jgi:hypothetical protein
METEYVLPDEISLNEIFSQLSVHYLLNLSETCKQFSNICSNNDLWQHYTNRDFVINPTPQGLINWRDIYIFYYRLLTNPIAAIPYVEDLLLRKRDENILTPFDEILFNKYMITIESNFTRPIGGYEHKLALYNPTTNTFLPQTSLDQIRILHPNTDIWRNITQRELNRQRLNMASYQQSLNALPQG